MQTARQTYAEIGLYFPRSRVKDTREEVRAFEFTKFILVLAFLGLAAFVHVYQQALVAQNGIDISRMKNTIKEDIRDGKNLRIQRMLLKSPARLERLATAKLGMVKPTDVKYIILSAETVAKSKTDQKIRSKNGLGAVLAKVSLLVDK